MATIRSHAHTITALDGFLKRRHFEGRVVPVYFFEPVAHIKKEKPKEAAVKGLKKVPITK